MVLKTGGQDDVVEQALMLTPQWLEIRVALTSCVVCCALLRMIKCIGTISLQNRLFHVLQVLRATTI